MRGLEESLFDLGYGRVAGVDEAGRGCLAGPVVAAAVLVERDRLVPGVDDSKVITPQVRERLAQAVRRAHPAHAVVAVGAEEIDRVNILQATRRAMTRAVASLSGRSRAPEMVLVDAVRLELELPHLPVIAGDQVSYAVACASILAKTTRDRMMAELDGRYPGYGFASNKGYGSREHRRALAERGPCPEHRLTFGSVLPRGRSAAEVRDNARAGAKSAAAGGA